jgi:hypothetical protein
VCPVEGEGWGMASVDLSRWQKLTEEIEDGLGEGGGDY